MTYTITTTRRFERSLKRCVKRGLNIAALKEVIERLSTHGSVDIKYHPHKLSGKYAGAWECHIAPDWLLVWEQNDEGFTLLLIDTGSHADIFG